jgi:leucyl-tRNA synthetase
LDGLKWPEEIKEAQRNWIGKSEGSLIKFKIFELGIKNEELKAKSENPSERAFVRAERKTTAQNLKVSEVEIFTTRADTLFGATFLVLAPEHPLIQNTTYKIQNTKEVDEYIKISKNKTQNERTENRHKSGVELKGIKAINPATNEEIPVWVADYVLGDVGTGAIMAVPAHDTRDFEFARKFGLPIKQVIAPHLIDSEHPPKKGANKSPRKGIIAFLKHPKEDKVVCLQWKMQDWRTLIVGGVEDGEDEVEAAAREIGEETGYKNFKLVKRYPWKTKTEFYAEHKKVNREAETSILFFELKNMDQDEVGDEEKELHEPEWIALDKLQELRPMAEKELVLRWLRDGDEAYSEKGILINSGKFSGMTSDKARKEITKFVGGKITSTYRLHDWLVSRQRYWGCPIPLVFCENCATNPESEKVRLKKVPNTKYPSEWTFVRADQIPNTNPGWFAVPDKDLPVKLPKVDDYLPTGDGRSPLARNEKWTKIKCPKCGSPAQRETDTLDTFVDSSWYFLRYLDPFSTKNFSLLKKQEAWMPVDVYSGGAEHTTMHLLYSRFFYKAMADLGLVPPAKALAGSDPAKPRRVRPPSVEPYTVRMNRGLIMGPDGQKMSKSRGNVIDPDEQVERVGADTVRMYLAFIGPYNEVGNYPWDMGGIAGLRRFLERVWKLNERVMAQSPQRQAKAKNQELRIKNQGLEVFLHKTIKKVGEDIEALKFNTAISAMMILLNYMEKNEVIPLILYSKFLILLSPFAPHITEELWRFWGNKSSIHKQKWPSYDRYLTLEEKNVYIIQINGKVRATLQAEPGLSQNELRSRAIIDDRLSDKLEGAKIIKVVFVPDKLINFVIAP